jgi:spore photoproduct lyase
MKFEVEKVFIEEGCRSSALVARVLARIPSGTAVHWIADGRTAIRRLPDCDDPFGAGKRSMVLMRRRGSFLMGCPAASREFACCGYRVMVLSSNCPMDCSYCFLQEYLADNPGLQVYTNYSDVFAELDRLSDRADERTLRIGTGELADSLAFDTVTGISRDLVEYFAARENLLLELKTKTDEVENLTGIDPKGRTLVSWTLSPDRVFRECEHRTAPPAARIQAARRVLAAGYKVAFHLDPIVAYPDAERDYLTLLDQLFSEIAPVRIAFISMGGLRMSPGLRSRARARFPHDSLLLGEEVLSPDGRYRTFAPLRLKLYARLRARIEAADPRLPAYLCMENPSAHRQVFGTAPKRPAILGASLIDARLADA